jgi:hypothetical protein
MFCEVSPLLQIIGVYAGVPPDIFKVAEPFDMPQLAEFIPDIVIVGPGVLVIVTVFIAVQWLESVTVHVYVPACRFVAVAEVFPLDHK